MLPCCTAGRATEVPGQGGQMRAEQFTNKAREALAGGQALAAERGHPEIGLEHILLACLQQPDGVAAPLFERAGASEPALRK